MNSTLSAYLDGLRFIAAVLVYLFHVGFYSGYRVPFIGNLGSEAVLVFFVLSGLVIANSNIGRHMHISDFFISRFTRLWSVMVPALILTFFLDSFGQFLNLSSYAPLNPYTPFKWIASIIINFSFLAQLWHLKISPGTNGPFWSISYEFWFYTIFAATIFFTGYKRLFLVATCILIAGPKIAMTYPLWYFGVILFFLLKIDFVFKPILGIILWLLSVVCGLSYFHFDIATFLEYIFPTLFQYSKAQWRVNFLPESTLLCFPIAINIYGFAMLSNCVKPLSKSKSVIIRKYADTSFGLYLFHYPLILFFKAILISPKGTLSAIDQTCIYISPLVISIILALWCERLKGITALKLHSTYFKAQNLYSIYRRTK